MLYRPYVQSYVLYSYELNEFQYQTPIIWPSKDTRNAAICFTTGARLDFSSFATDVVPSLTVLSLDANQCLPRYRYTKSGERIDNITDWALAQFEAHYAQYLAHERFLYRITDNIGLTVDNTDAEGPPIDFGFSDEPPTAVDRTPRWDGDYPAITKDLIFAYVYAVLHDPVYRETYALNLKREFPRIPFYPDFATWAAWGQTLLALHIGYENVEPWPLARVDTPNPKRAEGTHPKPVLKSVSEQNLVRVDEDTQLTGIPAKAWTYRLGNRSAIDWVLDQHKEKTPRSASSRFASATTSAGGKGCARVGAGMRSRRNAPSAAATAFCAWPSSSPTSARTFWSSARSWFASR